jgi:hypothetical protein
MKRAMCWWMAAALAASSEACVSASAVTNPQLLGSWQRAAQNSGGDQLVRDQVVTFGDDTSFRNHELSQRAPTAATQPGCVVDSDFQGSYVVNGDALAITYERATIARSNCANAQDNGQSAASDADITRYNDGEFGTGRSFSVRGDELTLSSPRGDTVYRRVRPPTANAAQVTSVAGAAGAQPAGGSAAVAPQQKPVRR